MKTDKKILLLSIFLIAGCNAINSPHPTPTNLQISQYPGQQPPTPTFIFIPTNTPIPTPIPTPIIETPPFTESTQSIQLFYPQCIHEDFSFQCYDQVLGIKYKYPSNWGVLLSAELISGTCGGFSYRYLFSGSNEVSAGGSSRDYCKGIGGDRYTMFRGFTSGQGCYQFPQAQDCRQVNDNVFVATLFPDFQSICNPGPDSIYLPQMVVGINIPGDHSVSGIIFSVNFLSAKGTDKLFEPLGGIFSDNSKCNDPMVETQFNQLVEEISLEVSRGTFDEETSYIVNGILDFANSITFSP
ncbi:MAG: hypothetical protein WAV05_10130 [Anaerolineales bacterium]